MPTASRLSPLPRALLAVVGAAGVLVGLWAAVLAAVWMRFLAGDGAHLVLVGYPAIAVAVVLIGLWLLCSAHCLAAAVRGALPDPRALRARQAVPAVIVAVVVLVAARLVL